MLNWLFPAVGFAALLWYLLRVLPKPSRVTYPCQQVAAPLAFGFLGSFTSFAGAVVAFRLARKNVWRARYGLATVCGLVAIICGVVTLNHATVNTQAARAPWTPVDPPNTPLGVARGIFPGRVVWVRDPSAVHWSGDEKKGHWWGPGRDRPAKGGRHDLRIPAEAHRCRR